MCCYECRTFWRRSKRTSVHSENQLTAEDPAAVRRRHDATGLSSVSSFVLENHDAVWLSYRDLIVKKKIGKRFPGNDRRNADGRWVIAANAVYVQIFLISCTPTRKFHRRKTRRYNIINRWGCRNDYFWVPKRKTYNNNIITATNWHKNE